MLNKYCITGQVAMYNRRRAGMQVAREERDGESKASSAHEDNIRTLEQTEFEYTIFSTPVAAAF